MFLRLFVAGLLFILSAPALPAQQTLTGQLIDAKTGEPLPFATLLHPATGRGALTNDAGRFELRLRAKADSLVASFIGYSPRRVSVDHFARYDTLRLTPTSYELSGATVYANDDYLYELVVKAGRRLNAADPQTAKTYFQVVTTSGEGQPLEMIQAYYNATTNKRGLVNLKLKGGRIALAPLKDHYFANLSTAQALGMLDLRFNAGKFPSNPLQYGNRALKRKFRLTRRADFSNETLLHLGFEPTKDNGKYFSGELWIDRETYLVHRIILQKDDVKQHPFLPEWEATEIGRIDLDLDFNFTPFNGMARLSHINIKYGALLGHGMNSGGTGQQELKMQGVLYCYDYLSDFFEPLFYYAAIHNDYRKISFLPYNPVLWATGQGLVLTPEQEEQVAYFYRDGQRINFEDQTSDGTSFLPVVNYLWSDKERYFLPKVDSIVGREQANGNGFARQAGPVARLFLDVTPTEDSLAFLSHTVLDVFHSAMDMSPGSETDCVINIFLDLCEIRRREMMLAIRASDQSFATIKIIHAKAQRDIAALKEEYFRRVGRKVNYRALSEYDRRVFRELGIRNLDLFLGG